MAISDIQDILYNWASGQTPFPVIWFNPNAPRPTFPYVALQMISAIKMGGDYISRPNIDDKRKIYSEYYLNLNISCYFAVDGSFIVPMDTLNNLRQSLRTEDVANYLHDNGVSFLKEISSILFLPVQVATGFESRATIDVQFGIVTEFEEDSYTIEKFEGEGTIKTNFDDLIIDYQGEVI